MCSLLRIQNSCSFSSRKPGNYDLQKKRHYLLLFYEYFCSNIIHHYSSTRLRMLLIFKLFFFKSLTFNFKQETYSVITDLVKKYFGFGRVQQSQRTFFQVSFILMLKGFIITLHFIEDHSDTSIPNNSFTYYFCGSSC